MGIPGEDLPGSWPATAFVAWYNGHPDFQGLPFDLSAERAVVSATATSPSTWRGCWRSRPAEIEPTDTTDEAIAAILGSGIEEILVLGRRGPAQAAFTTPELIELTELAGADLVVDPADLVLDPASAAALEDDTALARRNIEVLREAAATAPAGKPKTRRAPLLRLARRDPRRRGGSRRSRSSATSSSPTRTAGSAPSRPTSAR